MRRFSIFLLLVALVCLSCGVVVGCSDSEEATTTSVAADPATSTTAGSEGETSTTATSASTEPSDEPIVLRFGTGFMEGQAHSVPQAAFLDVIEEKSNGRVVFERYYGGTLVSSAESSAEIAAGIADIGMSSVVYAPGGYTLGNATQGFFARVSDTEALLQMHEEFRATFPELDEEVSQNKQLGWVATPADQIMTVKKPLSRVEDFAGMQLRSSARYSDTLKSMGAIPVQLPAGEMYMALEKGTIDGVMGALDQLGSMKLAEVVRYVTFVNFGVAPMPIMEINWDVWNSLPADIQALFEENSKALPQAYIDFFGGQVEAARGLFEEYGITVADLSEAELERLYAINDEISEKRAKDLDSNGARGSEMVAEARRLIEQYLAQ